VAATSMAQLESKKVAPARGELFPPLLGSPSLADGIPSPTARAVGDDFVLTNAQLKVTVNKKGRITSIVDTELNRELIEEGHSAGFVIFEDRPLNWDAW